MPRIGFFNEDDIFLDAAGSNPTFVARLGGSEPGAAASLVGADVEVVALTYDPNRNRIAQRPVASQWRDLQFIRCSDLVELVTRPCAHWYASFRASIVAGVLRFLSERLLGPDYDLDRLPLVHRPVAIGHLVETDDLIEHQAGSIFPSRTSGKSSSMYARTGAGPPLTVTLL
jgi:hypothetical protein